MLHIWPRQPQPTAAGHGCRLLREVGRTHQHQLLHKALQVRHLHRVWSDVAGNQVAA